MVPQQFPVGRVVVDRSHSIGKKVTASLLPNNDRNASVLGAGVGGSVNGPVTVCNGSTQYFESTTPVIVAAPFTLMCWAYGAPYASNKAFAGIGRVGNESRAAIYFSSTANKLGFFVGGSTYTQWERTNEDTVGTGFTSYAGTFVSASVGYLYKNGVLLTTNTEGGSSNFSTGLDYRLTLNGMRNNASVGLQSSYSMLGAILVNGGLKDVEISELHANPGQIFIPA